MTRRAWLAATTTLLVGCRVGGDPSPLVTMTVDAHGAGVSLRLIPSAGSRINAKQPPMLALTDGARIRFDRGTVDADGEYFIEPPEAVSGGSDRTLDGTLRIGVCPAGLSVCQWLEMPVVASVVLAP